MRFYAKKALGFYREPFLIVENFNFTKSLQFYVLLGIGKKFKRCASKAFNNHFSRLLQGQTSLTHIEKFFFIWLCNCSSVRANNIVCRNFKYWRRLCLCFFTQQQRTATLVSFGLLCLFADINKPRKRYRRSIV